MRYVRISSFLDFCEREKKVSKLYRKWTIFKHCDSACKRNFLHNNGKTVMALGKCIALFCLNYFQLLFYQQGGKFCLEISSPIADYVKTCVKVFCSRWDYYIEVFGKSKGWMRQEHAYY